MQEKFCRGERGHENEIHFRNQSKCEFFHFESLNRIFENNLIKAAKTDSVIADRLKEMKPLITVKSLVSMFDGVKDQLRDVLEMSRDIMHEMRSIYRRSRKSFQLADIKSDLKRIRKVKKLFPNCTLEELILAFSHRNDSDHLECSETVILEARKRLGSINYGPSADFAEIINGTDLDFLDEAILEEERNAPISKRQLNKIQKAIRDALKKKNHLSKTNSLNDLKGSNDYEKAVAVDQTTTEEEYNESDEIV